MTIFVSNLSFKVNDDQLNDLFTKFGGVNSARVMTDKMSGRSRGFGFVEMPDDAAAQKAIDGLNGTDYDGRPLSVNIARPKKEY